MNPHKDLLAAKELIFDACELVFSKLKIETESAEYGACTFHLNDNHITFRVAKS